MPAGVKKLAEVMCCALVRIIVFPEIHFAGRQVSGFHRHAIHGGLPLAGCGTIRSC